ncbi:2Fe-2S iron-sulfur cluster-binding protein [Streptomyces alboflavus]|uniref:2Fe-2S iron-sulfur cluster-binding protein n=1 Tax=Streptomyces alboflavus TaxID=67267 RepID=UPI0036997007
MTDGQRNGAGGWQPHPQGEYDADATAFVQLPEGAADAVSTPLAAPGHGYVPPQITVTPTAPDATDPAATGAWVLPPEVTGVAHTGGATQAVSWPDPGTQLGTHQEQQFPAEPQVPDAYDPRATGQWTFPDAVTPPEQNGGQGGVQNGHAPAAHDVTGQWSIPVADGDLPEESGEYSASSLAAQWGGAPPPATLPGGAPAPWATSWPTQAPEAPQVPQAPQAPQVPQAPELPHAPEASQASPYPAAQAFVEQAPLGPSAPAQESAPVPPARAAEETPFERTAKLFVVKQRPDGSLAPAGSPGDVTDAPDAPGAPDVPGMPDASGETVNPVDPAALEGDFGPQSAASTHLAPAADPHYGADPAYDENAYDESAPYEENTPYDMPPVQSADLAQSVGLAPAPGFPHTVDAVYPADPAHATDPSYDPDPALAPHPAHPAEPAADPAHPAAVAPAVPPHEADPAHVPAPAQAADPAPAGNPAPAPEQAHAAEAIPAADPAPAPVPEPDPAPDADHTPDPEEPTAADDAPEADDPAEADQDPEVEHAPEADHASEADDAEADLAADSDPVEADDPVADAPDNAPEPDAPAPDEHPLVSYVLRVNGADRPVTDAWIGESLLYVLRERLGLAGAKDGCSQGECGACNVQVDGRLVASCLVPAATAAGSEVRTVEGLAADGRPSDVQRALANCGAVQCGFCVPGMAMTLHDLLEGNPAPSDLETRRALCGNLCRCSGYRGVLDAVRDVVAEREAKGAAAEQRDDADTGTPRVPHQSGPYGQDGAQA